MTFKSTLSRKYVLAEDDYSEYTDESGKYWGSAGAGGVFLASDTKRLCFAKRSKYVNEPHTWGTWGGKLDEDETPEEAVRREVHEETGYTGTMELHEVYVFQDDKFRYTNFVIVIPHEFKPKLDWETEDFSWVTLDEIPKPLHPGTKKMIPSLKSFLKKQGSKASSSVTWESVWEHAKKHHTGEISTQATPRMKETISQLSFHKERGWPL